MQRFLSALDEAAKSYHWLKKLPADLPLIERFIQTGDKALESALLEVDQWHLRVLNPLAVLVARPSEWTDVDRRLVRLFALRSQRCMLRRDRRSVTRVLLGITCAC